MTVRRGQSGQAAVELVALLPVLVALLAGLWQAALVGHASWSAAVAARAAARAHALGLDARAAARAHLATPLERGLRVSESDGGKVTVTVRVPSPLGVARVGHTSATASFAAQR
jgi:Flp pilus assembly protein TadG